VPVLNHVFSLGVSCSAAGKVTAGLAESNGSLLPGGRFTVTCELTACTQGSAPGPMLGYEYAKPLPFYVPDITKSEFDNAKYNFTAN